MHRQIEPEWLDALPAQDERARRSRRDLQRVNVLMRQAGLMADALVTHARVPPRLIVDLGGGDGSFLLRVARRLFVHWRDVHVLSVDRGAVVGEDIRAGYRALGWRIEPVATDVFDFMQTVERADIITVNLFLHHLLDRDLAVLFAAAAARADLFVACEPHRALVPLWAARLLWVIGCNDVTRHDAVVSVRAGFRDRELSDLWSNEEWRVEEGAAGLFSHRFVARRMSGEAWLR